jgi:hypothetical protein
MTRASSEKVANVLEGATRRLQVLAHEGEGRIATVAKGFQGLAGHTEKILGLTSAIVESLESESLRSIFPKVQALGTSARLFFEERLNATTTILAAVEVEAKLLRQFSVVSRRQAGIALKTSVLTMFTNIEVGRLGDEGSGFQHLAQTLTEFSKTLTDDTEELARHIEARKPALEATRRALSAELPTLQEELGRLDAHLGDDMEALQHGLTELAEAPAQFRVCVDEIAQQVAQVVSAIQSHDITRQQMEHVEEAFLLISSNMRGPVGSRKSAAREASLAYAGLTIQIYQLQNIQATVAAWTSQIRSCIDIILSVSASDVAGISPLVLQREQEVSSRLVHIEQLEHEGEGYSERIRKTVGGRSTLMHLVSEHAEKSKVVRNHLHLLSLNSIIEASRLGRQADAVFEIASSISDISVEWGKVTDQSEAAMREILDLVEQTSATMQVFAEGGDERLNEAQVQTRAGLSQLQTIAAFAAERAGEIEFATETMRAMSSEVVNSGNLLDASYGLVDDILSAIEGLKLQMETADPTLEREIDANEMESLFTSSYTTQIERDVMHAALHGMPLPVAEQVAAGNSVELF